MWLVNTPSKHETLTQCWSNALPRLRRRSSIKPALVQRLAFAGLRSIACRSVKCWARVLVLASIDSALVSTSLWWECLHMAYTALKPFKCWPASYTMPWHRTNARYTSTLAGFVLANIHSALVNTSCWRESVHMVYTNPMPFECWSASYTITWCTIQTHCQLYRLLPTRCFEQKLG